jgi:tetratricopeptide (TPR) repeat protein
MVALRRRWRLGLVATIVGGALGVSGVLAAAGVRDWVILATGAAITPLMSGIALISRERWSRAAERQDELAVAVADGSVADADGRLYRVRDFPDPIRLGVHPAASLPGTTGRRGAGRIPPYVPRDIDGGLRQRLITAGFVLVAGDATAGKSRSAYEAVCATVPDHLLLAPASREALPAAVARMAREHRCVLWLDNLERFLGTGGLTRTGIARLLAGAGHHRLIVATLRAGEMERYADLSADPDEMRRQLAREVRETLEQADLVTLTRLASSAERVRAELFADDPRIADALAHADVYGLAEYLAAGPELLRIWEAAWDAGSSPRGAALVAAAVDCSRAGLTRPAPQALLEDLHTGYLLRRGGDRLQPEPLDAAWAWATQPRSATAALLEGTAHSGYIVFDYLVDAVQRQMTADDHIPPHALSLMLAHADPAEAETIGWTAIRQSHFPTAFQAFDHACASLTASLGAEHPETLGSRRSLACARYAMGWFAEAEADLRGVVRLCEHVLGSAHRQTLASRNDLAYVLADLGKLTEAESELRSILINAGTDDELRLAVREGIAVTYSRADRHAEADAEFRALIEDTAAVCGPDHLNMLTRRCYRGRSLAGLGRLAESEAEQRAVLDALLRTAGPEHYVTLQSRNNLGDVLWSLGRLAEAETEFSAVLEIRTRVLGSEHPATIGGYAALAAIRAELGRHAEAESDYRQLAMTCTRVLGSQDRSTLRIRRELADLLAVTGRIAVAREQLAAVLQAQEATLGKDHPDTSATRRSLESLKPPTAKP